MNMLSFSIYIFCFVYPRVSVYGLLKERRSAFINDNYSVTFQRPLVFEKSHLSWVWGCIPVTSALRRLRQVGCQEFKASLSYIVNTGSLDYARPCLRAGGKGQRKTHTQIEREKHTHTRIYTNIQWVRDEYPCKMTQFQAKIVSWGSHGGYSEGQNSSESGT